MTFEEIEARRDELELEASEVGYTDAIMKEWADLYDEEMRLKMHSAIAVARNGKETFFVEYMCECGYAINKRVDGEWEYSDGYTAVEVMKEFANLARKYNVKTVLVSSTSWLDIDYLNGLDNQHAEYEREAMHYDACTLYEKTGDRSLLDRYERTYEDGYEPLDYAGHPWDAPGMKVSDFICGVY